MEKLMVSTMPIKPYKNINMGLMIAPTICDVVGNNFKCKKAMAFNILHSYGNNEENLPGYLEKLHSFDINNYIITKDIDYTDKYLEKILELYDKGIIVAKDSTILRCNCGKTEMPKDSIKYKIDGNLYKWDNEKVICKSCNCECKEYNEKSLYLHIDPKIIDEISIYPLFLKKDIDDLSKKFADKDILISKNRQDKYYIEIDNKKYYIDIDMLWTFFNQIEDSDNQILIASNHQLYAMFISNYINTILKTKSIHYIATPYLSNGENLDLNEIINSNENPLLKKLIIIYSLKWKYKTVNWNNGIIQILKRLSNSELEELYYTISNIDFPLSSLSSGTKKIFESINLNNNIKRLRR